MLYYLVCRGYDEYMAKIKHPISYSEIKKHIEVRNLHSSIRREEQLRAKKKIFP